MDEKYDAYLYTICCTSQLAPKVPPVPKSPSLERQKYVGIIYLWKWGRTLRDYKLNIPRATAYSMIREHKSILRIVFAADLYNIIIDIIYLINYYNIRYHPKYLWRRQWWCCFSFWCCSLQPSVSIFSVIISSRIYYISTTTQQQHYLLTRRDGCIILIIAGIECYYILVVIVISGNS